MDYVYTRAFCRECRLHFEYATVRLDSSEEPVVICPRCGREAQHGPFQRCDARQFERIEAQFERLAAEADSKARKAARRRGKEDEWDYDFPGSRRRRR